MFLHAAGAHHGSGTSLTIESLRAAQPELALLQVEYRNCYRHPKPEVYERYGEMGIRRLRTDEADAVSLRLGASVESIEVSMYRTERPCYWHRR